MPDSKPPAAEGTVQERADQVAHEFDQLGDWKARYQYLADLADEGEVLAPEKRVEEHYVHSCQYDLWLTADYDETRGVLRFRAYSDSTITRGLAALLTRLLDEQPPTSVAEAELDVLEEIGLEDQLSPQRQNGLSGMIHEMKAAARDHLADETSA